MFLRCVLENMLVEVRREAAYITFVYLISSLLSSLSSGPSFLLGANHFLCHPALLRPCLFLLPSLFRLPPQMSSILSFLYIHFHFLFSSLFSPLSSLFPQLFSLLPGGRRSSQLPRRKLMSGIAPPVWRHTRAQTKHISDRMLSSL